MDVRIARTESDRTNESLNRVDDDERIASRFVARRRGDGGGGGGEKDRDARRTRGLQAARRAHRALRARRRARGFPREGIRRLARARGRRPSVCVRTRGLRSTTRGRRGRRRGVDVGRVGGVLLDRRPGREQRVRGRHRRRVVVRVDDGGRGRRGIAVPVRFRRSRFRLLRVRVRGVVLPGRRRRRRVRVVRRLRAQERRGRVRRDDGGLRGRRRRRVHRGVRGEWRIAAPDAAPNTCEILIRKFSFV